MAELYRRDNSPYWYAIVRDARAVGGFRRLSTKQRSKGEAGKVARAFQEAIDAEIDAAPPVARGQGLTWTQAAMLHQEMSGLSETTLASYVTRIGKIAAVLGDFALADLTHDELRRFCQERRKQVVTPGNNTITNRTVKDPTILADLSYVSAVYRFVVDHDIEGRPPTNPLTTFDRSFLRTSPIQDRHIVRSQFNDVLAVCKSSHHRAVLIMAVGTGMRTGEVLEAKWSEIDWDEKVLWFGHAGSSPTKRLRARGVPLDASVLNTLSAHREELIRKGRYHPHGYIFPHPTSTATVQKRMRDLGYLRTVIQQRLGLKAFTIHGLRHSFASWALQDGIDPIAIQRVLGHATLSTTNRYAHAVNEGVLGQFRQRDLRRSAHFPTHSSALVSGNKEKKPKKTTR